MHSINGQSHSLLDYLNDPGKAKQQLQSLGVNQQQSQDIGEDLTALTQSLSSDDLASLAEQIQTGETSVSLNRLQNMVGFYSQSINTELEHQISRFGLEQHSVLIEQRQGQWQVTADEAAPLQQLERLQSYLNKDERLATGMQHLAQLSSLSEWTQLQQQASQMQQDGADKEQLVAMLTQGREAIMGTRHFINGPNKGVALASSGLAEQMLDAMKED
ncbi:hypothetical protein HMF8227_00373 [Saliniradius amylolyticus]|uniref:Uncharacterized protein n=1 Tax=Saliniradius amylolyticus TaxID=2183582 RepID=A0A2S2DZU8_9ALTE|nr:hypothetical protein [Saliniradius amylolyticus]AWL10879.1 hypothetical protein HMF8227_00373 [Saliniradius amylolyticus]